MSNSEHQLNQVLGFWDLMAASVGQIIGAGIMSLTGAAIAMTGKSVPIAFIISAFLTIFRAVPYVSINSTIRLNGGAYTIVQLLVSKKLGGFYTIISTLGQLSLAMYALSAADYLMGLIGMGNRMIIAIIILTLFYVLNLFGVDKFAAIQNIIVAALVIALVVFTLFGIGKVDWAGMTREGEWMTDGIMGLLQASSLLTFATGGATIVANLAGEAKNPTRDIPLVIIVSTVAVAILYAVMACVAAGVLPLEQTAGQSLVNTARAILPYPLFVFFILAGAECALASTLNSQLASSTKPLLQATWDGWFPAGWGKLSKWKTPTLFLTVLYVIGMVTIITGMNIDAIGSLVILIGCFNEFVVAYGMLNMEKVIPEEWNSSAFHQPRSVVMFFFILAEICNVLNFWLNARGQATWVIIGNIVMAVVAVAYSFWRYNSGKVNAEIHYEKA